MELLVGAAVGACVTIMLALVLLIRKAAFSASTLPVTAEWINELSVERYRPMIRLLDQEEIQSLLSQPGFTPAMAARLREQRCQMFRGYLRSLCSDYGRVCAALKLLVLQAANDRPDLAGIVLRQQLTFACGLAMVHTRLWLFRWGVCGVDVTQLVRVFNCMSLELRQLVPAQVAVGA